MIYHFFVLWIFCFDHWTFFVYYGLDLKNLFRFVFYLVIAVSKKHNGIELIFNFAWNIRFYCLWKIMSGPKLTAWQKMKGFFFSSIVYSTPFWKNYPSDFFQFHFCPISFTIICFGLKVHFFFHILVLEFREERESC